MIIKILKTYRRLNTIFIDLHNVKAYKKGGFDEKDYAVAARKEAIRMRDEINSVYKG